MVLCETSAKNGTWNRHGVILISGGWGTGFPGLMRVSAEGGDPVPLTMPDAERGELGHFSPQFLPGGERYLYYSAARGPWGTAFTLNAAALGSKVKTELSRMPSQSRGVYDVPSPRYIAPGYLAFTRNDTLLVQQFDVQQLKVIGQPMTLAESVGLFSASETGMLVYQKDPPKSENPEAHQQLTWFDDNGAVTGTVGVSLEYGDGLALSPDGRCAAATISGNVGEDVWIIDVDRNVRARFASDSAINNGPVWSPDGSRIAFASSRFGGVVPNKLFQKAANGIGSEELLYELDSTYGLYIHDWSADGQYLVFGRLTIAALVFDIWALPLGDKKPFLYLESSYNKVQSQISPNGKWLAYSTNESGIYQIVIQTFPDPTRGRWQITEEGGMEPRWGSDGKFLYYLSLSGKLMIVPIHYDPSPRFGQLEELFQTALSMPSEIPFPTRYDVTNDGLRFLFTAPVQSPGGNKPSADVNCVLVAAINWPTGRLAG
jgi:hypothetical protein